MELSCLLGTTRRVPQEKFPRKQYTKSFIDQACSVKMAGYWPRSFFALLWTSTPSRFINTQKELGQYPAILTEHVVNNPYISIKVTVTVTAGERFYKCFIGQACSVKLAGYWPRSFFARLRTSTPSRFTNTQKKRTCPELGQYPAILTSHLVSNPYVWASVGPSHQ